MRASLTAVHYTLMEVWLVAKQAVSRVESFEKYRDYQLKKLAPLVVDVN